MQSKNVFENIPYDLLVIIFHYVDIKDLINLKQLQEFKSIINEPYNWINKLKLDLPFIKERFLNLKFDNNLDYNIKLYDKIIKTVERINSIVNDDHIEFDHQIESKVIDPSLLQNMGKVTDEYQKFYEIFKYQTENVYYNINIRANKYTIYVYDDPIGWTASDVLIDITLNEAINIYIKIVLNKN